MISRFVPPRAARSRLLDPMWHDLLLAVALMLVIEGLLPFLSPRTLRVMLLEMAAQGDRALRIVGLVSMLAGVGLLYLVN